MSWGRVRGAKDYGGGGLSRKDGEDAPSLGWVPPFPLSKDWSRETKL